ncbi:hypothetical protein [Candidatus Cetobacterium colombiensis]|uniref:Uncharacterized protein n=1 Tax=Candidatus Cetobacterium colombiensis TaxID=3073100 RepID=A0ABU4WE08_9FUSO|nr:hypothetical protein [Candidatus Cetobacterium colombiensis]MDX8337400.1 hypothetical protein [Candidatus Cetobacterium colombiensis]
MIKKIFILFILLQSITLSQWNLIKVPINKEETLFKNELMFELGLGDSLFSIMNVNDKNIVFTIFKKDGENPFKKENTTFRFKIDNTLIECHPTTGSFLGDDIIFSTSTLIISGDKQKEIIKNLKNSKELKLLIMNNQGIKMLFNVPLDSFHKQINEI